MNPVTDDSEEESSMAPSERFAGGKVSDAKTLRGRQ